MTFSHHYCSPLGLIWMAADEIGLTGLWFDGQRHFPRTLPEERELPVFETAVKWLDAYFSGEQPEEVPPLHLIGTPFQRAVWALLHTIPYGETVTYGALAKQAAHELGLERMSAQAVGGAVGRNPISILVPCHRVLGSNGGLTGYAGGIDRKRALLALEKK